MSTPVTVTLWWNFFPEPVLPGTSCSKTPSKSHTAPDSSLASPHSLSFSPWHLRRFADVLMISQMFRTTPHIVGHTLPRQQTHSPSNCRRDSGRLRRECHTSSRLNLTTDHRSDQGSMLSPSSTTKRLQCPMQRVTECRTQNWGTRDTWWMAPRGERKGPTNTAHRFRVAISLEHAFESLRKQEL